MYIYIYVYIYLFINIVYISIYCRTCERLVAFILGDVHNKWFLL